MTRPVLLTMIAALSGCATVQPRFEQDVAASFAQEAMRRMETPALELYYPESHAEEARRIASRLDHCAQALTALAGSPSGREKLVVFLTTSDFNNAYVQPPILGYPQQMVLPINMTLEVFDRFGIGMGEIGDVACHEAVHYIQFQQTDGFWAFVNTITGSLFSTQSFVEPWFIEGIATWYEGRLGKPIGRPSSPLWRGAFLSGAAHDGRLDAGYLSPEHRGPMPQGASYLTGMFFVDFLVRHYGEDKLWQLVATQGESVFSPLGVALRFKAVYGKSAGALFDDFSGELAAELASRARPATQRPLDPDLGYDARLASAPDGTLAAVTAGRDDVVRLTLWEKGGAVRASRRLAQILPGRRWIVASPTAVSGMSFTADSRWLYLVSADLNAIGAFTSRLWKVDAQTGEVAQIWRRLGGPGGCVAPDGKSYVYVDFEGDTGNLVRFDLVNGTREPLTRFEGRSSLGAPACGADGSLAFARRTDKGWDLWLRAADGVISRLTADGRFNYSPRFLADGRLLFLREQAGRAQAHVMDLREGIPVPVTDAPWAAMDPVPASDGRVAFLNREGWGWTLDLAPMEPVVAAVPTPAPLPALASPETSAPPAASANAEPEPVAQAALPPEPRTETLEPQGPPAASPEAPAAPETSPAAEPQAPEPSPGEIAFDQSEAPVEVLQDAPYSAIDHLFQPALHLPFAWFTGNPDTGEIGGLFAASLLGTDRLGMHTWALNLTYDTRDKAPSVALGYGNYQLAPWFIDVQGTLVRREPYWDRQVTLGVGRTFWTSPVRLSFDAVREHGFEDDSVTASTFAGPALSLGYAAAEGTPYGGVKRGLALSLGGRYFPSELGSDADLADLRLGADVWLPLPVLRRHSLRIGGVGRALLGAGTNRLLGLGGVSPGSSLLDFAASRATEPQSPQLLAVASPTFRESLRGYEDGVIAGTQALVGDASYVYPFIIDYGWASTLYLFRALLVRQLDVEAWASGARLLVPRTLDSEVAIRRAAGGAAWLRLSFAGLPVSLYYQAAYRFDEGLGTMHTFGASFE